MTLRFPGEARGHPPPPKRAGLCRTSDTIFYEWAWAKATQDRPAVPSWRGLVVRVRQFTKAAKTLLPCSQDFTPPSPIECYPIAR